MELLGKYRLVKEPRGGAFRRCLRCIFLRGADVLLSCPQQTGGLLKMGLE